MKTTRMWAVTGCLLTTLGSGAANAQSANFVMANNTAFTVYAVHIWPVETIHEGPDRLGNDTIRSGGTYVFTPHNGDCLYNVRVTFQDDGNDAQWNDVDLCRLTTLTLSYNYLLRNLTASTE